MSPRRTLALALLTALVTGCPAIFHVEHPARVRQIRPLPVSIALVGGTGTTDTPVVCAELPIGWPVRYTSFTATTADGRITGELAVEEDASDTMRTTYARGGHTWTCWQGPTARFDERSKGEATLTVSVPSANGPFDLRYVTGSQLTGVPQGEILSRRIVVLALDDHLDEWTASTAPRELGATLVGVTHGADRFVAVSSEALVATSTSGVRFEPGDTGVVEALSAVGFGEGRFVAVGDGVVLTSPDGLAWLPVRRDGAERLSAITWGDGTFVAVGVGGLALSSDDAEIWTSTAAGAARGFELFDVAHGNGRFVAVGAAGVVIHSVDATQWSAASDVPSGADLRGITWSGERFVAVGAAGTILSSVDGDVWTLAASGTVEPLADVTWGGGVFVAVSSGSVGRVLTSGDALVWTSRSVGTALPLRAITFARERWVVVGEAGLVLRAGIPIATEPVDLDLGAVPPGRESIAGVIEVDSVGTTKLGLLGIELSGDDAGEFRLVDPNACRGIDIVSGSSCALGVLFRPTSSGVKSAVVTIETNDPARPRISLAVAGLGSAVGVIDVVDPTPPSDDRVVTFVDVPPGTIAHQTLTLRNVGDAALVLGSIAAVNALEGPLSIGEDACSGATLAPGASCALELTFAPTSASIWADAFDVPSSDFAEPTAIVEVRATSKVPPTPSCPGATPSVPRLVRPEPGARDVPVPVELAWEASTDADGDTPSYDVFVCPSMDFDGCAPVRVAALAATRALGAAAPPSSPRASQAAALVAFAGLAGLALSMLGRRSGSVAPRVRRFALASALVMIAACSSSDGVPTKTRLFDGLDAGTTYYWKVRAIDADACARDSEVRAFTTR